MTSITSASAARTLAVITISTVFLLLLKAGLAEEVMRKNNMILVPKWIISGKSRGPVCNLLETLDDTTFVEDFINMTLGLASRDEPLPRTLWLPESAQSQAVRERFPDNPANGPRVTIRAPHHSNAINDFQRSGLAIFVENATNRTEHFGDGVYINYDYLHPENLSLERSSKNNFECSHNGSFTEPLYLLGDSSISINSDAKEIVRYRCFWKSGLKAVGIVGDSVYPDSLFDKNTTRIFPSSYDFLVLTLIGRKQFFYNEEIRQDIQHQLQLVRRQCR